MLQQILAASAGLLAFASAIYGDVPTDAVRILAERCTACHGETRMSGLDMRTREGLVRGGTRGASIHPGDASSSVLVQAVLRAGELQMPPNADQLSEEDIAVLRKWVDEGALWPTDPAVTSAETWWSFRPVSRPSVPQAGEDWARGDIDRFIARGHARQGLARVPESDRRTWIRRATYDLHGLPPTPEEVESFLTDDSPEAFARVVDRLLESKRYGERWGRYWLDAVRYADSGGFETDIYFRDAWRYRDYVIKSFNDDKPFDQFIREQVAADEIWPDDIELRGSYDIPEEKQRHLDARIGTGLYTVGTVYHEAALDGRQLRYEWMVDSVDVTGEAFLGLTISCARCHDHKFDPISQKDYHRMMAFFEGTEIRRIPVVNKMTEFGYYSAYPRQLQVFEYQEAIKALDARVRERRVDEIAAGFDDVIVAAYRKPKKKRSVEEQVKAAILERALTEAGLLENPGGYTQDPGHTKEERDLRDTLINKLGEAASRAFFELQAATVLGRADVSYPTRMTHRGDWRSTGDVVEPGVPAVLSGAIEAAAPGGRRKALANWLSDPGNPLVARVMVNRIWQGHFGEGIVRTPNNFGRQGEPPSHPELLNWLAAEFVESGWSVKAIHRLIMLSSAYRAGSGSEPSNLAKDPSNVQLWRMNRRRLDAESLRDAVLAVAGSLNPKMGGRPVRPPLSKEERLGMWDQNDWPESFDASEHNRRSVYIFAKRQFPYPMFKTFDAPDPASSCGRRAVTTVAPQALTLLNSEFMLRSAEALAERIASPEDPEQTVRTAWELSFSRPPDQDEMEQAVEMLANAGTRDFCLMLFNLNEFIYID